MEESHAKKRFINSKYLDANNEDGKDVDSKDE
jgi:hypothetical protein